MNQGPSLTAQTPSPELLAFVRDSASLQVLKEYAAQNGLGDHAIHEGTIEEATAWLRDHPTPKQLIVEVGSAAAAPDQLNALADVCAPGLRLIVAGSINEFSFYQWLKHIGVDEYLLQPFKADAVKQALSAKSPPLSPSTTEKKRGEVTAFIGTRGGVGTTTLATNLAWMLAHEHQRPTLLLDLDAHFGTGAMTLDLEPSRGIAPLFENPERVDGLFLERVLIRHSDRLFLLSAEEALKEALPQTQRTADVILPRLRERFEHIVVDVPRMLTPLSRAMLTQADRVIVVTEPSLPGLRDLLRIQDYLKEALQRPQPLVIINREGLHPKAEVKRGDFEKHFGRAAESHIPFLQEALTASANGEVLAQLTRNSPALQPLLALAARLAGAEGEAGTAGSAKPGLLGKFIKGK